jgi:threonine/homoserine/homoserine lactone efflux protein
VDLIAVLPAFLLAVVFISASPGPAVFLILRRAALRGTKATLPTVAGLEAGLYIWALAAGAGLAALVAVSTTAYTVLRVVGAGVLIYLGLKAWYAGWKARGDVELNVETSSASGPRSFTEGLIVQLANPKAAVFMFAFYPQFVPQDGNVLGWTALLAAIQVTVEFALYMGFAALVGRASGWFRKAKIRRRLEAASGTVLVALGVRVAVDR